MSYINKRVRAFNKGPSDEVFSIRSEGRMKNYPSALDIRAWSDTVEERRQHILEYMAKNKRGICPDKLIPLDVLIDAMMTQKNDRIKKLEKRIDYLEKLLDLYSQLDLTAEQKQKLDKLKKDIEEAYAELDLLKSERNDLDTVYDRRKKKSDLFSSSKPKKRDEKKGETEGVSSPKKAQRKKKARVLAREIPDTSGDEQISPPKKYRGKRKSEKSDISQSEKPTNFAEEQGISRNKIKPIPPFTSDSTGKKKKSSSTIIKDRNAKGAIRKPVSEPSEEHPPISQEAAIERKMRPVVVPRKKPISDTEYELHPEKSQRKQSFPEHKGRTDVTSRPRSGSPRSSEQKTKEQEKEVPKASVSRKVEKSLTGDDKSKDAMRKDRSIKSEPIIIPQEKIKTSTEGDKTIAGSATEEGKKTLQRKSTKSKQDKAEDIPQKTSFPKAKPKSSTKNKDEDSKVEKPVVRVEHVDEKPAEVMMKEKKETQKSVTLPQSSEEQPKRKTKKKEEKPQDKSTASASEEKKVDGAKIGKSHLEKEKGSKGSTPKDETESQDEAKEGKPQKLKKTIIDTSDNDESMKKIIKPKTEKIVIDGEKSARAGEMSQEVSELPAVRRLVKKPEKEAPMEDDKSKEVKKVVEKMKDSDIPAKEPTSDQKTIRKKSTTGIIAEKDIPVLKKLSGTSGLQEKMIPQVRNDESGYKTKEQHRHVVDGKSERTGRKLKPHPDLDEVEKDGTPEESFKSSRDDKRGNVQTGSQEKHTKEIESDTKTERLEQDKISGKITKKGISSIPDSKDMPKKKEPIKSVKEDEKERGIEPKTEKNISETLPDERQSKIDASDKSKIVESKQIADEIPESAEKIVDGKGKTELEKLEPMKIHRSPDREKPAIEEIPPKTIEKAGKQIADGIPEFAEKIVDGKGKTELKKLEPMKIDRIPDQEEPAIEEIPPETIEKAGKQIADGIPELAEKIVDGKGKTELKKLEPMKIHRSPDQEKPAIEEIPPETIEKAGKQIADGIPELAEKIVDGKGKTELKKLEPMKIHRSPDQEKPAIEEIPPETIEKAGKQIDDRTPELAEKIVDGKGKTELKKLEPMKIDRIPDQEEAAIEEIPPETIEKAGKQIEDGIPELAEKIVDGKGKTELKKSEPMKTDRSSDQEKPAIEVKKPQEISTAEEILPETIEKAEDISDIIEQAEEKPMLKDSEKPTTIKETKVVPIETREEPGNIEKQTTKEVGKEPIRLTESKPIPETQKLSEESEKEMISEDMKSVVSQEIKESRQDEKFTVKQKEIEKSPSEDEDIPLPDRVDEVSKKKKAGEVIDEIKSKISKKIMKPKSIVEGVEESEIDIKLVPYEETDEETELVEIEVGKKKGSSPETEPFKTSYEFEIPKQLSEREIMERSIAEPVAVSAESGKDETESPMEGRDITAEDEPSEQLHKDERQKITEELQKAKGEQRPDEEEKPIQGEPEIEEPLEIVESAKERGREVEDQKAEIEGLKILDVPMKEELEDVVVKPKIIVSEGLEEQVAEKVDIPKDQLDHAWEADHQKREIASDVRLREEIQKDVQTQQHEHRCAALIRHAKERCAALASSSGGIVALPDSKKEKQDMIPTGYWSGEVLQELPPPQSISVVPDWAEEREMLTTPGDIVDTGIVLSKDRVTQSELHQKEGIKCQALCSKTIHQPREKLETHPEEQDNADVLAYRDDSPDGVNQGISIRQSSDIPPGIDRIDGLDADGLTEIKTEPPLFGSKPIDGGSAEKSQARTYAPKLELAWEEVDIEDLIEDDDEFASNALIGNRISRVLSGDTSGLGTATFPVAFNGSKTLSGEILRRRFSDKVLRKKSSEMKPQTIVKRTSEQQLLEAEKLIKQEVQRPCSAMITRQQFSPRDDEQLLVEKQGEKDDRTCSAIHAKRIRVEKEVENESNTQTTTPVVDLQREEVIEPSTLEKPMRDVSEPEPVIKLFERDLHLDRDVTSEEQIQESISDEIKSQLENILQSLDDTPASGVEKDIKLINEIEESIPDLSQHQDIDQKESDHSRVVTVDSCHTVTPIQEKDEFVSAIDTSTTNDEAIFEEILEKETILPSDNYHLRRSEEDIDIVTSLAKINIDLGKQIPVIDSSPEEEVNAVEEITPVEIPNVEDGKDEFQYQAESSYPIEDVIMAADFKLSDVPDTDEFISSVETSTTKDVAVVAEPITEVESVQTSIIMNDINIVEEATTIDNISMAEAIEDTQNLDEADIVGEIIENIVAAVDETITDIDHPAVFVTPIVRDNMLTSLASYEIVLENFNEPEIDYTIQSDDQNNEGLIELYLGVYDCYTPRIQSLKDSEELAEIQMDKSIVPDSSRQVISKDSIPRATTVESTTITEDILDKVIGVNAVPTPGEINRLLNDRFLPLPNVPPSSVLPVLQQPPATALPQAEFSAVPRAVMPEFVPTPVPVSRGLLPRLFGTKRSDNCNLKRDSGSQTEDQLKHTKTAGTICPKTKLVCDCCKKAIAVTQGVCKGICADIKSKPKKDVCRGPCAKPVKNAHIRPGVRRGVEDKQGDGNQDGLEKLKLSVTPKDSKEDLPTMIIHKDAEIIALRNALVAKESYCAEQRKIAAAALEQLENIKNIVEERDDLRKKLETSQDELEELKRNIALGYPFGISETRPSGSLDGCEEEITALENEINDMRSGKLTPNLEAQVIRKEVEVLKKYCSKLSVIQKENHQLKNEIAKYEDKLNSLGCLGDDDRIEVLKEKLNTLNETVNERDVLKCKCNKLEEELMSYNDLPEDIEVFKQRSLLLDEVLQDRDRLSKRVEQLRGVDEELYNLRKKCSRVDELEEKLKRLSKDKKSQEEELEHLRCKCSFAEIDALNQKAEGDTLRSKITCLEHEVESMKCLCKDKERLKQERDDLQRNLDELVRMQNNFDYMKNQMKCLDMLKKEKDVYKTKYENLMGLECECDILRAQVERAKVIEKERNALENQVEDLENCIADQENEIRRLVCHIDILAKGRDEQQEKLKDVLCTMRSELDKKDHIIKSSDKKLSLVQKELITSIQGLSSETTNLKSRNDTLGKCICNLQNDRRNLEKENEDLKNSLSQLHKEKSGFQEDKTNLQTCLCNLKMTVESSSEEQSLMKVQIAKLKRDAEDLNKQIKELTFDNEFLIETLEEREAYIKSLQDVLKDHEPMLQNLEILKQTARDDSDRYELEAAKFQQQPQKNLTGDEHLHELLRQSKHAVQRIALELCKQYEEWDCVKNKLKQIKKVDQFKERRRRCTCCTSSRLKNNSTQDRSGNDKSVTAKMMDSSATQDDGVVKDNKAVSAKGLENAETQYKKKHGIATKDHTEWDCYMKRDQRDKEKVYDDDRSPCVCKSVGITAEECEQLKCQAMEGTKKLDKKIGEVCEYASTGTTCYLDEYSATRRQDAASRDISFKPCECKKDIQEDKERVALKPTYEYDVSKWSCKTTVKSDPKDDTRGYEFDVSKWSCRQPKPEEHKMEEETEDEMHTARSNEDKCKHLEDRIEILERELAQANETVLKLQEKLAATDRTAAENQALRRHSSEVQEVAKDQIEDLVEHLKKSKERGAFLEEENDKLSNLLKNMQLEKDELMKIIKGLQEEIEKGAGDTDVLSKLRKELEDCLNEKSILQKRIVMLEKQLSDNVTEDEKLRDLLAANKKLEERLEHEMNLRQQLEGDKEDLKKHIAELEKTLSDAELLKAGDSSGMDELRLKELEELRKQLKDTVKSTGDTGELDRLKKELDDEKNKSKNLDELMSEIQKLKNEKADIEKMLASNVLTTSRRSSVMENELVAVAKKNKELQEKNFRMKQFENDKIDLSQELASCKDENKQLKDELDKAKSELDKLNKQKPDSDVIDALRKENEDLLKKLEAQAKEMGDLLDKMRTPKPVAEISKSQLDREIREKQTLQSIIADLENQLKNVSRDDKKIQPILPSDDLQKTISDLTKRLEEKQARADAAELALRNMRTSDPSAMLNAAIAKLEKQLTEIEGENAKLKQQLAQSTNEATTLKKDLDTALNEAKKVNEENAQLKQHISDLQKENSDLKSSIDKLKSGLSGDDFLKSEIKQLKDQIAQLEKDRASLRNEVAQKDNEIKNAYNKITKLQNEIGELKQNQVKLQSDNDKMKKDLDNASNNAEKNAARISQLENDNSKLKKDIQNLEGELAKVKRDLDSALNAAKKGTSGVSDLQEEIMKLKQKCNQLEVENANLKRDLNAALDNSTSSAAKLAQLTDEVDKLKKAKDAAESKLEKLYMDLDSANADAKKTASNLERQQNDIAGMKEKLLKLEAENAKLKKDLNAAADDAKKSPAYIDQDANLKQKLAQLENENSKLKKDLEKTSDEAKKASGLDKLKDEENKLRERLGKLEAENSKLNKDLSAALGKLNKATDTISQLQDSQNKWKEKLSSLESENAQLKKDLNKSLDDAKKYVSEISNLRDSESKLKQRIAQLESENAKLKTNLDTAVDGVKNNLNMIQSLKDDNNKLLQKAAQLEQENSILKKDLEAALKDKKLPIPIDDNEKLKLQISQLENANGKLKKDLDNVFEDHKKCPKTISQLQDEIERLKKKIAELEKDGSNLKRQYEGAMGDMKTNNDELNKLKESESKLKQLLAKVQTDNDKLNKDVTALTAELKTTEGNLVSAKNEAAKAKQRVGLLEDENAQLKNSLGGTLDELKKVQNSLSQLQEENPKLKQRIAQLETENAKLKKELDAAIADAKKGSAGADQMRSDDTKLRNLLAQLEKDNKKLKADLNTALDQAKKSVADVTKMRDDDSKQKQQIAKLENENAKLKKDLEKAINDALANSSGAQGLRDENNKLKQKINQLEEEIAKLKADLDAALDNAKKGASGLSQMQADDAKLKQRISQLDKDNAKLKSDLEAALNEARSGNDTGTKLRSDNAKQKQMIGQLEDEIAKLKKNLENALNDSKKGDSGLSNMQDENAKLKQRIGQLEKDNATLKKSLDDVSTNAKAASTANALLTDENNKLKQKVKQLQADLDQLRKDLNTALDDNKKVLANLSSVRDGETKLKKRIAELESDNTKLKQDLDAAFGDAKSGKGDLNKIRDENASMRQRIAQLEGDNSKLKKELGDALNDTKNKAGEVQRLKDEIAKLKQKIADLEISNSKLKKDLDSALSDSKNAANELVKLTEEIAKLKEASTQKDSQLNDMKKKLDIGKDKDSTIAELTNENNKLKGRIRDLENQLAKLGDDLAKLKRELLQKDGQIDKLKESLERTIADNKNKDTKIKGLENNIVEHGSLDESLAKLKQEMGLRDKQVNDLKNRLEKVMNDNKNKDAKINELANENEKLKARLKDLENQLGKTNEGFKIANDTAKKAAEDLTKMREDYNKLKADNEKLMAKAKLNADEMKEYEAKMKQLQAELSRQKKECTDNIASMKEQFDRDMKDLLKKNEASIAKLQKAHEEFLKQLNENHDNDIESLQKALRKAKTDLDEITKERDRLKALLDVQRRKSIEIKDKVEQVENIVKKERKKSKEESQKSKDLEVKLDAEIKKSKDLESMSFILKKQSEELAKEKESIQGKANKLEEEKERLERSSLEIKKAFEDEKRKSIEITKKFEDLNKKISDISTPTEKKEEPVPVYKTKEPLEMKTFKTFSTDAAMPDVIAITTPLSDKELKFFGKTSCSCEPNLVTVLEKLTKFGMDGLGIEELQLLHTKICDATANVLAKIGQSSGVLKPNENDKLGLLRRIASLEGDLLKKQKHAQQKVIAMQYAVKLEKERLSDLRKSLDEEKLKNSELLSQIGSQSKVVSNIQEERDLIQRQKSYHEQKLEQYLVAVEEERGKSRNLEDELEKEKSNNQHLKSLLEAERNRSRQNKRKDTEALETMRIKLEKTVNSEMMLRMKLQEKTCRRHPSPHTITPVRDGQQMRHPQQSSSRTRSAFYTDLSPGDGTSRPHMKRTFSSHSGGQSGSSNGLDLEDK